MAAEISSKGKSFLQLQLPAFINSCSQNQFGMEQSLRAGLKAGVQKGRLNNTKCSQVVMERKEEGSSISLEEKKKNGYWTGKRLHVARLELKYRSW